MTKRIIATFRPQGWQNDYAIDLDPEGPTTFDVTDAVLAMGREKALALEDNQYNTDELRNLPSAPQWIRDWGGPFEVEVEESIRNYFGVKTENKFVFSDEQVATGKLKA